MPAFAQTHPGLRAACERYWEAVLERYPTKATEQGDYRYNDRLEDLSIAARDRWRETLNKLLTDLRELPAPVLPEEDRLTRALLERVIRDELLRLACLDEYLPLDPLYGMHLRLPLLLVSQPFRHADDFRAYAARLRGFPRQVTDVLHNLRAGRKRDIVSPRAIVEKIIPQVRAQVIADPTKTEFYKPLVQHADKLAAADRDAVTAEITDAIRGEVIPSYLRLLAFLEDDYLPAARDTVGLGALPGGDEVYKARIYLNTTVQLEPEALHKLGLSEVARIRGEMDKVRQDVAFDGSLDSFLAHMRDDPKYRFKSGDELFRAADAILQRAKPLMPQLFGRLPKADCVMKEVEPFRAPAAPVAYYNPPPEDGSRPGYYYINTYAPTERLTYTLEALSYHEAVPGHHLQIALHQETRDLPSFRRYAGFTAFVEGWGLYTEKLGYEIGGYTDPYSRFGQLTFEMWRACRLVVDTGMHHKGWSRQKAIDFMAENSSLARVDIENEIDRYITWPGQALAYKVGELRILDLRGEAENALRARFDIRAFHDALLAEGAMPIDMLEQRMREWIKKQEGGS